ncbi:MAG TPA: flippase-like domain-containing protein [Candidatus Tenderia sp.]|nr:flippase-like domain-containing protein [Candidatus Tenderia sp.]
MKLKMLAGLLIAGLFVWGVEYAIGWRALLAPWQAMSLAAMSLAVALLFVSYTLRAVRLYDYFHGAMAGRFGLALKLVLQHNLFNNYLPMRAGEISFPVLAQRYFGIAPLQSVPVLFWFRLLDLHTLGLFALAGLGFGLLSPWMGSAAMVLWLCLPPLSYFARQRLQGWCARRSEQRFHSLLHKVLESLPQSGAEFWRSWGWTVLNWAVKIAVFCWVLLAFVPLPLPAALMAVIAGDLTSVLPIHGVAGIGTYEAGVVAGAATSGLALESVVVGAVNLHLFVLGVCLLGGAVSLLLGRKAKRRAVV